MIQMMQLLTRQWHSMKLRVLLVTMLGISNGVLAIDISQSPLFIDKSATPNVMFISG